MNKEYTPAEAKAWLSGYDAGKKICMSERNIQTTDTKPEESLQPWVKTYSGGKPNYTERIEPTIDGWPLWSGLPQPKE
jgi:hypothetical protein